MSQKKNDDDEAGLGSDPFESPLLEALYGVREKDAPKASASRVAKPGSDDEGRPSVQRTPAHGTLEHGVDDGEPRPKSARKRGRGNRRPLPDGRTYRLVTFSFYEDDVELLDALLADAKASNVRGASRSLIMRLALRQVDLSALKDRL